MLVNRAASLRDHAFPTFSLRAFPRRWLVDHRHALQWFTEWQLREQRLAFFERQLGDIAAIKPHDVKHVIRDTAVAPRDLTVEDQLALGELRDRALHAGKVLRKVIARKKLD